MATLVLILVLLTLKPRVLYFGIDISIEWIFFQLLLLLIDMPSKIWICMSLFSFNLHYYTSQCSKKVGYFLF